MCMYRVVAVTVIIRTLMGQVICGNMPVYSSQSGMFDLCTDSSCNWLDYENIWS